MTHVTLIGDSIFDNKVYVGAGKSTSEHLVELMGELMGEYRGNAALAAVDGATTRDVAGQLKSVSKDTTHLVLSVGGNDALGELDILDMPVEDSMIVFKELSKRVSAFRVRYEELLDKILEKGLPLTVCTVYYPRMPDPIYQTIACAALASFNDAILVAAFKRALPVIDLRLVCDEDEDYANPIEPSEQGGLKIARAIRRAVLLRQKQTSESIVAETIVYV